ncbi:hypothetical protein SLEP1_g59703, partial [Rubroshorea leprosula]
MAVPVAPVCYVGVAGQCLAFHFMRQTVPSLISVCELIFACICVYCYLADCLDGVARVGLRNHGGGGRSWYVGVACQWPALLFMKQTVRSLISGCELIFTCIC